MNGEHIDDPVYMSISGYAIVGTRCLPWLHRHKRCSVREVILADKNNSDKYLFILTTLSSDDLITYLASNRGFRRLTLEDIVIHKIYDASMTNTLCTLEF